MKTILRYFPEEYKLHLQHRKEKNIDIDNIIKLDNEVKKFIYEEQQMRNQIKKTSTGVEVREISLKYKAQLKEILASSTIKQEELKKHISFLPNVLHYSTPIGQNEDDNQIIYIHKSFVKDEFITKFQNINTSSASDLDSANSSAKNSSANNIINNSLYNQTLDLIKDYIAKSEKNFVQSSISSYWINIKDLPILETFQEIFISNHNIETSKNTITIQNIIEKYHHIYNYFIYQKENNIANLIKQLFDENFPNINDFIVTKRVKKSLAHNIIGEKMNILHMSKGAEISGTRFPIMSDELAELARGLARFLLDVQKQHGFREIKIPSIATNNSFYNAGQLPKFEDQTFKINDRQRLIPTAEVILANILQNIHVEDKKLPIRYCALSPCFRSEAGSLGRDTTGLIRLHEFEKVELFTYCNKNDEEKELQYMLECAYKPLELLGIKFRIIALCSGDIGFTAVKTYDIETWLPSQQRFLEISSCSSCGNFQTSRSNTKYKLDKTKDFLITLNGSGLPITRLLAVFMETFYNEKENYITIPPILQKYMNNKDKIIAQLPLY